MVAEGPLESAAAGLQVWPAPEERPVQHNSPVDEGLTCGFASGGSSCSTQHPKRQPSTQPPAAASSTLRVGCSEFEPVLSARTRTGGGELLAPRGAPPRRLLPYMAAWKPPASSTQADKPIAQPWSPQIAVPRAAKRRLANTLAATTAETATDGSRTEVGEAGKGGTSTEGLRKELLLLGPWESEQSIGTCQGLSSVLSEISVDNRPPSVATLKEGAFNGRELLSRGVTYRGFLREAVSELADDRALLAQHRMDCQKATEKKDRARAAAWQRATDRKVQISELRWQLLDPIQRQALFTGKSMEGRIMPSPVHNESEEYADGADGASPRPSHRLSQMKPQRPHQQRMRTLQKMASRHRRHRLSATKVSFCGSSINSNSSSGTSESDGPEEENEPPPPSILASMRRSTYRKRLTMAAGMTNNSKYKTNKESVADPSGLSSFWASARDSQAKVEGALRKKAIRGDGDFTDRDAAVLLEAFSRHDKDNSGSLDQAELVECLNTMGLRPKTSQERKEFRQVIWNLDQLEFTFPEFSKEVVPAVRAKFVKLREARLGQLFHEVDVHGQGTVTVPEVLNALRRHGILVGQEVCDEAFGSFHGVLQRRKQQSDTGSVVPPTSGWKEASMGLKDFVEFVCILEEHTDRYQQEQFARTAQLLGLGPEDEEAWGSDLVDFHRMFHEYDPIAGHYGSPNGTLEEAQFVAVVRESGYLPHGKQRNLVTEWFHKVQRSDGTIGFPEFLTVMRKLREIDRDRLRRIVDIRMPERNGAVAITEVHDLLREYGVVARNAMEHEEIGALVEVSQNADIGTLGREDVVVLCQRIASKLRVMRHERERQYVLSVGWTEQHYCEFRTTFLAFDKDMSGNLERNEVVKAVEMLGGHFSHSNASMNLMFVALGIDPKKDVKIDFLTFLRLMKMLDESETRREKGASMGIGRDRTDMIYSIFQALEPEGNGTVRRELVLSAMTGAMAGKLAKPQINEVLRFISQEPLEVDFGCFLRSLKSVKTILEVDLDEVVDGLQNWKEAKTMHENEESRKRRPSLLRLVRADVAHRRTITK